MGWGLGRLALADQVSGTTGSRIATEIQQRLQSDPDLKNDKIQIAFDNGVVTLKGTVDSEAEKAKAAKLATVGGVKVVDNQLKVGSEGARAAIGDSTITARLKAELVAKDELRQVHVETNNGVVTLAGTVPSEYAHRQAVELAKTASGVRRVDDELRVVMPGEPSGH
jgi:osmotically-inducible protein OsmY